jgi:tetratricopeptide (TPR) repeat protein
MKELHEKFNANYTTSPDYSIDFFKGHAIIFNNIKSFEYESDLLLFMEIYYSCINAFIIKGQHNNALSSLLKVVPVIEQSIDKFKIDRVTFNFYKWILFLQANAYYNLKDYSPALNIFKQLYAYEPENDIFKQWIEYSKYGRLSKYSSVMWIFLLIALIVSVFGKSVVPFYIRFPLLCVGLLTSIAYAIIEYYLKRKRSRVKA